MENFYQGSCRCSELIPFLRTVFAAHGWEIVDEELVSAQWFVAQRRSARGDIITYLISEPSFPNYREVSITPSYAVTDNQDGNGVYVSAYTPLDQTLHKTPFSPNPGAKTVASLLGSAGLGYYDLYYYTTLKQDLEASPVHVFYTLAFVEDNFFIRVRGNPAVTGNTTAYGPFVMLDATPELEFQQPQGLWGGIINTGSNLTHVAPSGDVWSAAAFTTAYGLGNLGYLWDRDYNNASNPKGNIVLRSYGTDLIVFIPPDFFMSLTGVSGGIDEVSMYSIGNANRLYMANSWSVWCADHPQSVTVTDTGTQYQLDWSNPDIESLSAIRVLARTDAYPEAFDDPLAFLVYENLSPVPGDAVQTLDVDAGRYAASEVFYGVFARHNATPAAIWSLPSDTSRAYTTRAVEDFSNITLALAHYKPWGVSSNEEKINTYHLPLVSLAMEDNAADKIVVDAMGNLNGTLVGAQNTEDLTIPGKNGSALSLANHYITLNNINSTLINPAAIYKSYSVSMWAKLLTTDPQTHRVFYDLGMVSTITNGRISMAVPYETTAGVGGAGKERLYFMGYSGNAHVAYSFKPMRAMPIDTDWHHFLLLKEQGWIYFYVDNVFVGSKAANTSSHYTSGTANSHYIGGLYSTYFGNQFANIAVDSVELFPWKLNTSQKEYLWNGGNGRASSVVNTGPGYRVGYVAGSAGEFITYKMEKDFNARGKAIISFEAQSEVAGLVVEVGIGEEPSALTYSPVTFSSAGSWEPHTINLSGVSDNLKGALRFIGVRVLDNSTGNVVSLRNITGSYS